MTKTMMTMVCGLLMTMMSQAQIMHNYDLTGFEKEVVFLWMSSEKLIHTEENDTVDLAVFKLERLGLLAAWFENGISTYCVYAPYTELHKEMIIDALNEEAIKIGDNHWILLYDDNSSSSVELKYSNESASDLHWTFEFTSITPKNRWSKHDEPLVPRKDGEGEKELMRME